MKAKSTFAGVAVAALLIALPATAGTVRTSVGIIIRESNGTMLSAGEAKYTNVFGYETDEVIDVRHWINNTSAAVNITRAAPYYDSIETDEPGAPPNCYSAEISAAADDSTHTSRSDDVCYSGPPHPDEFPTWDPGTNQFDPLVFDLNGDGIRTSGADRPVTFDVNADGTAESLTWLEPDSEDAFLWTDLNSNARVDNGAELFGVGTMLPNGQRARHGYEALSMYDQASHGGDGNGLIDARDAVWQRLRLWRDDDHDGYCDAGEWAPIHRYGVESISLTWIKVNVTDASGTLHLLRGMYDRRVTESGSGSSAVRRMVEALGFRKLN